jgi:hypothetical protein
MIAIGRDGEKVLFIGGNDGKMVTIEATFSEAAGVLRQLNALLGEAAPVLRQEADRVAPAPWKLGPEPPKAIVRDMVMIADAAAEARARDAAELAAQTANVPRIVQRQVSEEALASQERRRQRLLQNGAGGDDEV